MFRLALLFILPALLCAQEPPPMENPANAHYPLITGPNIQPDPVLVIVPALMGAQNFYTLPPGDMVEACFQGGKQINCAVLLGFDGLPLPVGPPAFTGPHYDKQICNDAIRMNMYGAPVEYWCFGEGSPRINLRTLYPIPERTPKMHYAWLTSLVMVDAMQIGDVLSSRGKYEGNPLIGRGKFNTANASWEKVGIYGTYSLFQYFVHRSHHHRLDGVMTEANGAVVTVYSAVIAHNVGVNK